MAGGFAAVANGGTYLEPVAFTKVCRSDGSVYMDAFDVQITRVQAFKESTAWMLVDLLIGCCSNNVEGSTGKKANFRRRYRGGQDRYKLGLPRRDVRGA